jgi:hypothetical protein
MTPAKFRELALAMLGASEGEHMNHPDFRIKGRIFATIHPDDRIGALNLPPDEQRELVDRHPETFTPASGAWGRQGWTKVQLASADAAAVRAAITLAYERVGSKPSRRPSRK